MRYTTVIFDMDGVLMDSEGVITRAAIACLAEHGVSAEPRDFDPFRGTGEDRFIGGVAEKYGLTYHPAMKRRTYEIYATVVDAELHRYPGIPELLTALRSRGYRVGLGSSADAVKVLANLRAAGIGLDLFDARATGDEVARKKPHPDLFELAARRLGSAPRDCLVVEDALVGLAAAQAAGMDCVAVKGTFPDAELRATAALTLLDKTSDLLAWLDSRGG